MWKVDIYLETDSIFQGKRERKCGYVLSTMVGNEEKTKEKLRNLEGNIPPVCPYSTYRGSFQDECFLRNLCTYTG